MARFNGGAGGDTLAGGAAADVLNGASGADRLDGAGGDDRINGGEGADRILGGDGDDILNGFGASDVSESSGAINALLLSDNFSGSVFATSAPGDPDRLMVLEKDLGRIRIMDTTSGAIAATAFLDIPDSEFLRGGEQGVLGLAFHPDYATNGRFFIYLTNTSGNLEVREYTRSAGNPDVANTTFDVILTIPHPSFGNHNGGWMAFGPDGMLYIATGDGGSGGDPNNNAQNINTLLGKMLRIDVNGDDFAADSGRDYAIPDDNAFVGVAGADEIWALGLRNPWRPSFDRETGDLYIADVGQGEREELNFQAADAGAGVNYGWRVREGTLSFSPGTTPGTQPLTDPVHEYSHVGAPDGGFSVTGGYVYRGTAGGMQGVYFYADFVTDQLWSFRVVDGVAIDIANRTQQLVVEGGAVDSIASFAEDGRGNLYIIGLDGEVFRITPGVGAGDLGDTIDGGAGNDRIYGGVGNDRLSGGEGVDTLFGGTQDDSLDGGIGNDTLAGQAGDDVLMGRFGNDRLVGAAGDDRLLGGQGIDVLIGGEGGDTLEGGTGNDRLSGQGGFDQFVFRAGEGRDTVTDFADNIDTLLFDDGLGVASASAALGRAAQVGANVVFSFAGGEQVTVLNATLAALLDDIAII